MNIHGEYRSIYTTLKDDEEFIATSPTAKAVLYTLKLELPAIGIGSVAIQSLGTLVNASRADLDLAIEELTPKWLRREKSLFWLVNGLRFHPNLSPKDRKHRVYVTSQLNALPRAALTVAFRQHYPEWIIQPPTEPLPSGSEGPTEDHGSKKTEEEDEYVDRTTSSGASADAVSEGNDTPSEAPPADAGAYCRALITSANQGMGDNPDIGYRLNPIPHGHGKSTAAADDIRLAGVTLEFAKTEIYEIAKAYTPSARSRQISSLGFCTERVIERWERQVAADDAVHTTRPRTATRSRRARSPHDQMRDTLARMKEPTP